MQKIYITSVTEQQIEEVVAYVKKCRQLLFPMLDHSIVPRDLTAFKETYLTNTQGCFLQARNQEGHILGVIGMLAYDHRFDYLNYKNQSTVEVVRLYIEPPYRKKGLATQLFETLLQQARKNSIECLYLHTHPFLTGALEYWQKQGFELITTSIDGEFTTLHMNRSLSD